MLKCLMCREPIGYRGICETCKVLNQKKRDEHVDLKGYIALVTGARIKIGYATALRLLRDGATVIAVTRFPYDAIKRYAEEEDYELFKERLFIYQLDLRYVNEIYQLIDYVECEFGALDILINNAAQTIKRHRNYYLKLQENEKQLRLRYKMEDQLESLKRYVQAQAIEGIPLQLGLLDTKSEVATYEESPMYNSWVAKPEDLSLEELLEVQLINVTAPFLMVSHFKKVMLKSSKLNRFIINVSSVEGKFYKKSKLSRHVHTNMAKASLNMLTHSLSMGYAKEHIYMYSVDPGWVSNQFPEGYEVSKTFEPYLSFEDGATRICSPIYENLRKEKIDDVGVYYKDFEIENY